MSENHKAAGKDLIIAEFLKKEKKPYGEEHTTLLNWSGHNTKCLKNGP